MTLADVNYTPTPPISEETQEEINEANEAIEEVEEIIENIPIEEIVEGVEEVAIEEPTVEVAEPTIEEPTVEIEQQAFQESFEENFTAILEEEGLQEGFESIEQGTTTIQDAEKASSFTIRGSAYKKGARNAYIAKTKTELESELTELYANTEINANSELFNEKVNEIR